MPTAEQYEEDAAEAARAQADARRKRIMEKGKQRLGVVSGDVALDEEEKKQSKSNAARIRAARQRRYGKKSAAPTTTATEATTTKEESGESAAAAPADDSSAAKQDSKPSEVKTEAKDTKKPEPVAKEETKKDSSDATDEKETKTQTEEPKKKYVGVAKMRRNMIKKKKLLEAEDSSKSGAGISSSKSVDVVIKKPATTKKGFAIPIYMHIVTILLLFLAGMDAGLQQYHEDVTIHDTLAIHEFGVPVIHRSLWKSGKSYVSGFDKLQADDSSIDASDMHKGEFQDDFEEEYVPNIDPVFGVDLDEVTKGPGILNQLARAAISVHRMFLSVVYYAPARIIQSLLAIPGALIQRPPLLCLVALFIRQVVGKMILKAGIPEPESDDKDGAIDVLAMVKNTVTRFLSSTFPTFVGMYDAFVHLRSDLYVVICGFLCGMIWSLQSQSLAFKVGSTGTITDEL